jgi:hypothetical protein
MPTVACSACGQLFSGSVGEPCPYCIHLPEAVRYPVPAARDVEAGPEPHRVPERESRGRGDRLPANPGPGGRNQIEGTVLQTFGPSQAQGRRDAWRLGSTLLLLVALCPVVLGFWAIALAWRLVLRIAGLRGGGGRGLFSEIVAFHLVGNALRTPEPIPVYDHVVDTGTGLVQARQEGEFQEGRILAGSRVRLQGRLRGGTLVIEEGFNETLGTQLSFRPSPWRVVFALLFLLVVTELAFLAAYAPPTLPGR